MARKTKHIVAAQIGADGKLFSKELKVMDRKTRSFAQSQRRHYKKLADDQVRDQKKAQAKIRQEQRRTMAEVRQASRQRLMGGYVGGAGKAGRASERTTRRGAIMGGGGSRVSGALKGAMAFGGVYGAVAEIQRAKEFESAMVDIGVRAKMSVSQLKELRDQVLSTSDQYRIGKEHIAEYVRWIVDKTGNIKLAKNSMADLSAVAYSTNSDIGALAGVVKDLNAHLGISPRRMKEAFGVLAAQADKGAVALDQMQNVLPEVLSKAALFGHKGMGALRDYGAALQFAVRTSGSVAEASTSIKRAMDMIATKRTGIEKTLGVSLKTENGWKGLGEMMQLIAGKLAEIKRKGGAMKVLDRKGRITKKTQDVEKWIATTFGVRGMKMLTAYLQQAMVGFGAKVGGLESYETIRGAGGAGTIDRRVGRKKTLMGAVGGWNSAINRFRNQMHKELLPVIKQLGNVLPHVASGLTIVLKNWKLLLAVWATGKMRAMLQNMAAAAGGGAPTAGAPAVAGAAGGAGVAATKGAKPTLSATIAKGMLYVQGALVAYGLGKAIYNLIEKHRYAAGDDPTKIAKEDTARAKAAYVGGVARERIQARIKDFEKGKEGKRMLTEAEKYASMDISKMSPEQLKAYRQRGEQLRSKMLTKTEQLKGMMDPKFAAAVRPVDITDPAGGSQVLKHIDYKIGMLVDKQDVLAQIERDAATAGEIAFKALLQAMRPTAQPGPRNTPKQNFGRFYQQQMRQG